ncbi:unnamed protein product, partial [Effrenium voratum]
PGPHGRSKLGTRALAMARGLMRMGSFHAWQGRRPLQVQLCHLCLQRVQCVGGGAGGTAEDPDLGLLTQRRLVRGGPAQRGAAGVGAGPGAVSAPAAGAAGAMQRHYRQHSPDHLGPWNGLARVAGTLRQAGRGAR